MRPVSQLAAVAALCAGCNIVYSPSPPALVLPDAGSRIDRQVFGDVSRLDLGRPEAPAPSAVGRPCEDAPCPYPLVCAQRSCGPERACAAPVTLCEQTYDPVCDCAGATLQNECAARAAGGGVAYAGPCDGRPPDGGPDATAVADAPGAGDATARMDAGPSRCAGSVCDDGFICCAEPTSPAYGRCQALACVTCCRRGE
jgi:hypothetical protein